MALEQQLLGPVPDLQSRGQDEITWLPGLHEAFPHKTTRKRLSYLLTLDLIRLQADSLFEGLEKGVFGSVVNLYLLIVVCRLLCNRAKPVVGHFSGDRGWLPLVATADDLDASTLESVEESFQGGAGHCADLVPDNHTGNEHANVSGESPIDCHAGHMVAWMPEPLEIGFCFTHTLERCRLTSLHVDTDNVSRIIVRVPQPSVPMFYASLLNVREVADWGWLPGVLFLGHDTCSVVFPEGSFG